MRVRELPILFNDEMVQALLTGRKTCTRRAIKLPDKMTGRPIGKSGDSSNPLGFFYPGGIKRPPYQPGDILYVRETWSEIKNADGSHKKYVYKASDQYPFGESRYIIKFNWKPSIHMPKKAARIWLKVTDVRVERLQDITEDGAKEKGANFKNGKNVGLEEKMRRTAIERFAEIWNSTIKKTDIDRYGWDANPWVWVIEFERCKSRERSSNGY